MTSEILRSKGNRNYLPNAKSLRIKRGNSRRYIMKRFLFWFVQCTWGILQTLVGAILLLCVSHKIEGHVWYRKASASTVLSTKLSGAISLGAFIICFYAPDEDTYKHEFGHCIQSLILGPLFLFVIGLPSLIWCGCFDKYRQKHNISYYSFYTEKWANKLGGVK